MEAGKFVLHISELRIADLIDSAIASSAQHAESKQIRLVANCADADKTIFADRDRLCQVFINLQSNAIKFSPEEETITVSAEYNGQGLIKFSITDKGRGIPEELRIKIFERFIQVEKSDATDRGGTGLGLAISKAIVEQHGGHIGVGSQIGVGSTFWFMIPVGQSTAVE